MPIVFENIRPTDQFMRDSQTGKLVGIRSGNSGQISYLNSSNFVDQYGRNVNYGPLTALSSTDTLGDSITNYGIDGVNGSYSNSYIGWCNDYLLASGGVPFDVINVYAQPSKTLEDVISTQLTPCLASGSQCAWLHVGINNINTGLGFNDTVATIMANFATVITALSAVKNIVIVDSLNPVSQSGSTGAAGRAYTIPLINAALKNYCATFANVIFNDTYSAMVDTTSTANNPLTNMVRTDDGIHFVSIGAQKAGYASFQNLLPRVKLSKYKNVGANALPAFSGTGGASTGGSFITVTGTPPVGWELLGVSGASGTQTVTISSLAPDMIRLTFANTGGASATTYLRVNNLQASFAGGQLVQGGFGFQSSGMVGLNRIALALRQNGTTVWNAMGSSPNEPTITYPNISHTGYRQCPPWVIPAGALTNLEFIIAINNGATTGTSTIDIFAPSLNRLT